MTIHAGVVTRVKATTALETDMGATAIVTTMAVHSLAVARTLASRIWKATDLIVRRNDRRIGTAIRGIGILVTSSCEISVWGRFQDPPYLTTTPFHRFGVNIKGRCCLSRTGTTRNARKHGARVDRQKLRQIDLHWHDLRHEGACRLLSDDVDIRTIQLMLGHADIKQTQRYLNITDEELRKGMTGVWERRGQLRAVGH